MNKEHTDVMERRKLDAALFEMLDRGQPDVEQVRSLLAQGANPNAVVSVLRSPTIVAVAGKVADGTENMLHATALAVASLSGSEEAVRILLEAGANPDKGIKMSNRNADPLECVCAAYGDSASGVSGRGVRIVELLLEYGADTRRSQALKHLAEDRLDLHSVLLKHPQAPSVLSFVLRYTRSIDLATRLLDAGADINGDNSGQTPLEAAADGDPKYVEFLLSRGADASRKPFNDAMWRACRYGKPETIRLLCEHGAAVNDGSLHAVLDSRKDECIVALMEGVHRRGTDPRTIKLRADHGSRTVLEHLLRNDYPLSAEFMFRQLGEDLYQTMPGGTPLLQMCGPAVRKMVLSLRTHGLIEDAIPVGEQNMKTAKMGVGPL